MGPLLSSFCPNSRELVGFWGCVGRAPIDRGVKLLRLGSWRSPRGHCGAFLLAGVVASRHVPFIDVFHRQLMASGQSCLVEELWHAPPRRSTSFWRWDVRATWSRSGRGDTTALGARGSRPSMIAGGPKGSRIPSSPTRRHARSGRRAWCKVEWGLDSLSVVP